MYELVDTFNGRTISRHRSLRTAVQADIKHDRAVKRANGEASYIPTSITCDGQPLTEDEREQVMRMRLQYEIA